MSVLRAQRQVLAVFGLPLFFCNVNGLYNDVICGSSNSDDVLWFGQGIIGVNHNM